MWSLFLWCTGSKYCKKIQNLPVKKFDQQFCKKKKKKNLQWNRMNWEHQKSLSRRSSITSVVAAVPGGRLPLQAASARSPINVSEMFQRAPAAFCCVMFYLFEIPPFYTTKCSLSLSLRQRPVLLSSPLRGFLLCVSNGYRLPLPCNKSVEATQSGSFDTCMHTCMHACIQSRVHT